MVFSSLFFCFAFLPANLICYFTCKTMKAKNIVMLVFSLVFYAWGEPVYILLLLMASFCCWFFSQLIGKTDNTVKRKFFLAAAVAVCIGTIGFFKYIGFIIENLNFIAGKTLIEVPAVALPIGISFYTFQLLTYVVDVYRKEVQAQKTYWKVLLYTSLFHQCIAGPIVRYGDIENEISERTANLRELSRGITKFSIGLAKKAVLANGCGAVVDTLLLTADAIGNKTLLAENLAVLEGRSALTLWVGIAFYMLQIYLDFSAYSDMAIGMGLMLGFHYKENFDYPYISTSVTEFWRRWHISLGSFFRDYVYIPLGGNRKGKIRQIFNLFVVWSLTGLWHGASWNFVIWGLYFFILLMTEKLFIGNFLNKHRTAGRLYVLASVYFSWIFFRFTNFSLIKAVFKGLICMNGNRFASYEAKSFISGYTFFFILCCIACTPAVKYLGNLIRNRARKSIPENILYRAADCIIPAILIIISALSLVGDSYNPFLYFQF